MQHALGDPLGVELGGSLGVSEGDTDGELLGEIKIKGFEKLVDKDDQGGDDGYLDSYPHGIGDLEAYYTDCKA